MAPRKNTEAKDTPPAPLTEDNIDELDDEALAAAMEAMEAGETADDAPDEDKPAPEPSEAKEEGKADDAEEAAETDDAKPGEKSTAPEPTIPKSRLDKEVAVRKAAEERAEQMQKRFDQLMELSRQKTGEDKPKEEARQEQWIDPRKDIFGAYEQLKKGYEQLVGHTNTQHQQTEQERQFTAALQESDADIISYIEEVPEAGGALEYLRNSRRAELAAMGYGPQEQRQDLLNIQAQFAGMAKERGVRVGKLLHDLAVARGYQPQAQPNNAGGKPTASAADPSKKIEDMNRLEDTKQRAQSLGGSGAPVEVSGITMEDLATMSDADFKKLAKIADEKGVDVLELISG